MPKEFIESVMDAKNWKPNITQIMEETGLSFSTVKNRIEKRLENRTLQLHVWELTESEAKKQQEED